MMDVSQAVEEAKRLVRLLNANADQAELEGEYYGTLRIGRDDATEFIDAIETLIWEAPCLANSYDA